MKRMNQNALDYGCKHRSFAPKFGIIILLKIWRGVPSLRAVSPSHTLTAVKTSGLGPHAEYFGVTCGQMFRDPLPALRICF